MPRKAPDGEGVTEHRITLGNYERAQLNETMAVINKATTWNTNRAIGTTAVIGGGVVCLGVASYALWRWVGLGSITDRVSEYFSNLYKDNIVDPIVTSAFDLTGVDDKIQATLGRYIKTIETEYEITAKPLLEIINSPTASSAEKAQASQDLDTARKRRDRRMKQLLKKYREAVDKATYSGGQDLDPFQGGLEFLGELEERYG